MLDTTLLIVSDKFHNFATRKDVITKSELYNLLNSKNIIFTTSTKICLIPGQGFSEQAIEEIMQTVKSSSNSSHFELRMMHNVPKRASKKLTHKYHVENILISEPTRSSEDVFSMDILIDEECEMMRDHQTGLHVQGMLLLEASRQGYLAIFEKFFLNKDIEKKYFIFNNLNVDYNNFAFPIPATLNVNIRTKDLGLKKQHAIMDMEIIQCGNISASFSLDMTVMANKRISLMENKLANQSLDSHINYLLSNQHVSEVAHA